MNSPNAIRTCWIAYVKRDLNLTRGKSHRNQGDKIGPPPDPVYKAIREVIEDFRNTQGRIPTYHEIQKAALLKLQANNSDPFLETEKWAMSTGIKDLSERHHDYLE